MARLLETTFLNGPAGRLEALHEGPEDGVKIERAAVVCHPHPLFGGTLHNKVVFRIARGIRETGAAVLRFNFRGAGQSGGEHDHGKGEQDDVRAAVAYMRDRYPGLPLTIAGFSFGSSMGLKVACSDPAIERVIGCGVPVDRASFGFLKSCACPRYFIHSTNDEYGSQARMDEVYEETPAPKKLVYIEAEDHFFKGALDEFEEAVKQAAVYRF